MRNIAMILTYEGTAYHGWQVQKNAISVCETMERAASMVLGHKAKITGCGRTDAGVHARNYVANVHTDSRIPEEFNAIGSCVKKEYTYQIYNSRIRDPFYVNRACFYPKHLDENVMQQAADRFVGTHDFSAVRSVGTDVKSTVRTVHYFEVERRDQLILLRICANGFLYNMARAMSGTVIYAAEGKFPPEAVTEILEKGDRTAAGPTLPPGGLYMTKLWYECGEVSFHVG